MARRRDRNGDVVFFDGGNANGISRDSRLCFRGIELGGVVGTIRGLNFGPPPLRQGGWYLVPQTLGSSETLKYEGIVSLCQRGTHRARGGVRGGCGGGGIRIMDLPVTSHEMDSCRSDRNRSAHGNVGRRCCEGF